MFNSNLDQKFTIIYYLSKIFLDSSFVTQKTKISEIRKKFINFGPKIREFGFKISVNTVLEETSLYFQPHKFQ